MKKFAKIILVSIIAAFLLYQVDALGESTQNIYVVSGNQVINARSCPRLNCAVVTTFNPGETFPVLEIVQGDVVAGSTEWYQISFAGKKVYVHSSLVSPANDDINRQLEIASDVTSTDWTEYHATGMSVKVPSDWLNLSGDEDLARFLAKYSQEEISADILAIRYVNGFILQHPNTQTGISIYAIYNGLESPLSIFQMNVSSYIREAGFEVVEIGVVDVAGGKAVRSHYGTHSKDNNILDNEYVEYDLFRDRVLYIIVIQNVNGISRDDLSVAESIVQTLDIRSATDMRHALSAQAGVAQVGENHGEILSGQCQLWTYEGIQGETTTIRVTSDKATPEGPDTYLIIRAPNNEIIIESDDYSNSAPYVKGLVLPQTGTYEIEIFAYSDFEVGNYTLLIGDDVLPNGKSGMASLSLPTNLM